jgi:toxin ParE1/3/4
VSQISYRLTEAAAEDVEQILIESARLFGPVQRDRYASILEKAIGMVADNPNRVGSRGRDDLSPGLRSFHLELAARRLGAASHIVFYMTTDRGDAVIVVRVLHESMDSTRHIGPRTE